MELSPVSSAIVVGLGAQLTWVAKGSNGAVLTGRTATWSSSNSAVASVASGFVTARTVGTASITATVESVSATVPVQAADGSGAFLSRPFSVTFDVQTSNYFDHNVPRQFVDANGEYIPYWGESSVMGIDGHNGYDWRLPIGTPLLAVAAGRVTVATMTGTPFVCPVLNNTTVTVNPALRVEHTLPNGLVLQTIYFHMSRIDVSVGQQVQAGDQIALSGDLGCSVAPHLHFGVDRNTADGTRVLIDPYGWEGTGADPWTLDAGGAASMGLWKPGEAPTLFRSVIQPLPTTAGSFVLMTQARFQGVRDAATPNNEFVEVTRDARVAPTQLDITGYTLTTKAGAVYTFPAGTVLSDAKPSVRVYTGTGVNSASTLDWGRAAGVLDNRVECLRFINPTLGLRNQFSWGSGCT